MKITKITRSQISFSGSSSSYCDIVFYDSFHVSTNLTCFLIFKSHGQIKIKINRQLNIHFTINH
ncbi:hypothetical protein BpHYR1_023013 [Brachionus plicatilis]|uniref:Uncharacterized protein n=1 Tax=Brachionus plicatilis TaxID=10195 RepID=A0A3M7QE85_BRAPC|nr:hypothetical protein BpHYR1_023013 [Brachionus plicatilis]